MTAIGDFTVFYLFVHFNIYHKLRSVLIKLLRIITNIIVNLVSKKKRRNRRQKKNFTEQLKKRGTTKKYVVLSVIKASNK